MSWRVGIDIGGAFTDLLAYNEKTGETLWIKVESTPPEFEKGVIEAIKKSRLDLARVKYVTHGQTVVINTIVTRSGVKVGFITTKNFRDIIEIGRANRRDLFNLKYKKPEPFVPRHLRLEVDERTLYDGGILTPLSEGDVRGVIQKLIEHKVESIAIGFINSYANPEHELKAKKIVEEELRKMGMNIPVTLSHETTSEWREYERFNTAVLNAYVLPRVKNYIEALESNFKGSGFRGTFYMMLSNAGVATASYLKRYPIFAIEGGPIAGTVGAIALAELLSYPDIIVLDGGSTTTKASLVKNLLPRIITEYYIGQDKYRAGYPVRVPIVEVVEIGNGGTSIAWIDETGRLRVGPKAAGAYPGPACYGKGGEEPTVTDSYVINGYLNPEYLLGGELKINKHLAENSIEKLAKQLSMSLEDTAFAIIKISNEQASSVIRQISVQKGYDPREFVLVAHGGAGPMFAPFIAEELRIPAIVVPAIPAGVFNAWGMIMADIRHDIVHTRITRIEDNENIAILIDETFNFLERQILKIFEEEGFEPEKVILVRYANMRYYGQEWTLKVPVMVGKIGLNEVNEIERRFHEAHEREYGFKLIGNPVEIVDFHMAGIYRVTKPILNELPEGGSLDKAIIGEREVYFGKKDGFKEVQIYKKELLPKDSTISGPAIVEETTATTIIPVNFKAKVDKYGNLILTYISAST
jgi:N-methylhydantoinase A